MMNQGGAPLAAASEPIIWARIINCDDAAAMLRNNEQRKDGGRAFERHSFPTTAAEFDATLKEIGANGGKPSVYITSEYKTAIPGLSLRLPSNAHVDELNYLAARLSEITKHERGIFSAVMETGRHCDGMRGIINVTHNLNCFDVQPATNLSQYAEFLAEMNKDYVAEGFERLAMFKEPDMRELVAYIERLEQYFDAEAYARDLIAAEKGVFFPNGYLAEFGEYKEVYHDRRDIPAAYRLEPLNAERAPAERVSAMDRLAAAQETVSRTDAAKPSAPARHEPEL